MNERLLQYIWQYQYFNTRQLTLSSGSKLSIVDPGIFNTHQGPDFLQGKCRIDDTLLIGNIELHIRASDWNRHLHQHDPNYQNIILHVVLYNDLSARELNIPTLVLEDRVPQMLLSQYENWMNTNSAIPCKGNLTTKQFGLWQHIKSDLLTARLDRKSGVLKSILNRKNYHWEEAFWILLARTFGSSNNADAFEAIAETLPLTLIGRHKTQIHQLEALLFGQGNILNSEFSEAYPIMLQKEYRFLQKKYSLIPISQQLHFLRMRPINFPTVRLAQLAMFIHKEGPVFALVRESTSTKDIRLLFELVANDYWHYHFLPDQPSNYLPKKLGPTMIDSILINAVIPSIYLYGMYTQSNSIVAKAYQWLEEIKPERIQQVELMHELGFPLQSAADSQALLELKGNWCDTRNCLQCAIGNSILQSG